MNNGSDTNKDGFLEAVKAARQERALEKNRENSIIKVQSYVRRWLTQRKIHQDGLQTFDKLLGKPGEDVQLRPAIEVYEAAKTLFFISKKETDSPRLEHLCRHIVQSLESNAKNLSYVGLVLTKEYAIPWVAHIKQLLKKCCQVLKNLSPEYPADMRSLSIYLHTLISFTGTKTWVLLNNAKNDVLRAGMNIICNTIVEFLVAEGLLLSLKAVLRRGLCRSAISLKHASLSAIIRLTLLPLQNSQFSEKMVTAFLIHILSVPGLMLHLQRVSPESLALVSKCSILPRSLNLLNSEQNLKIIFNALEGSYALCLLGNMVHLAHVERDTSLPPHCFPAFTNVVIWLLESCQHYVEVKQSNLTHWHPILGWFSQKVDAALQEAVPHTKAQLHYLASGPLVSAILGGPLAAAVSDLPSPTMEPSSSPPGPLTAILQKVTDRRVSRTGTTNSAVKINDEQCRRIALSCSLYRTALSTLTQLKLDIITGICYQDRVLHNLWRLIAGIGLKQFLDQLPASSRNEQPELQMLHLYAECMTHYVSILDDVEMYEQQEPFKLQDFVAMSHFFNIFLYKAISQNLFDVKTLNSNSLFQSIHMLFLVLFKRDCRKRYTPDNHWLIKEIRISSFISDLEKGKKPVQMLLQKMPNILPQAERVRFFKKLVEADKEVSGLTESACLFPQRTHITVHRARIVEDGYRQLAALPPLALKGVVRVHFINEQGLNEAGIDQDGVFKEFLEETIKRVFDPGLNLFRVTSDQRLYPSPTSHLIDEHLKLFEFVGRILGKAVYEGIVVDVPFASFFLSQLLVQSHLALHSAMDELPSLDPELYQSLTFIKHTTTDVSELDLTFSVDSDYLGQVVTRELLPGGKAIPVTDQNKISYIHLMAHFRMHTQIKDQTAAFIRGFRSIINPDWLGLFSTPELQRLISGDNVPVDMRALRKYTQYYGGFHDSHRVIIWLWDVLDKDFTEREKALFLKFVTSCSKPPLLGFAHLEPPFSIRCVEVSDDDDPGDTVGSVIRGFFTIRKKDPQTRLPTSSTCFNLLKLPNYQKKSTLREKLRYAVSSNTGFELS